MNDRLARQMGWQGSVPDCRTFGAAGGSSWAVALMLGLIGRKILLQSLEPQLEQISRAALYDRLPQSTTLGTSVVI